MDFAISALFKRLTSLIGVAIYKVHVLFVFYLCLNNDTETKIAKSVQLREKTNHIYVPDKSPSTDIVFTVQGTNKWY